MAVNTCDWTFTSKISAMPGTHNKNTSKISFTWRWFCYFLFSFFLLRHFLQRKPHFVRKHLAIFYSANKQRQGRRVICLHKEYAGFHQKNRPKKWQGGHLLGAFRTSAFAPFLARSCATSSERLRRCSNPCRGLLSE